MCKSLKYLMVFIGALTLGISVSKSQNLVKSNGKAMNSQEIERFHILLDNKAQQTQSIQAQFSQLRHFDFSDKVTESKGRLLFKKNNKIRWEYLSPENRYIVFNDQKIGAKDANQSNTLDINKMPILKEMNNLIQNFSNGSKMLDPKISDVSYFEHKEGYLVVLKPKDKRSSRFINRVEILFDAKEAWPNQMRIIQANKDYTDIKFHDMRRNQNISDNLFILP